MNSYQVYKHKTKETKSVKVGFAWLAIPFNLCWFISRGLWQVFFSYILIIRKSCNTPPRSGQPQDSKNEEIAKLKAQREASRCNSIN